MSEVDKKFRQAHAPRFLLSLTLINDGLWLLPYNHQVFSVRNITLFLRQWRLDYRSLLYRHECFTGKYTTRKIHKNYIRDPSGSERGDGFESRLISMKKEKKNKNRGLDLGGLGARRGKKKDLGKGTGSGSWYTGPGTGPGKGRGRGAGERGVSR